MAQVEFCYNGISTIIQCKLNEKMKDVFQKFKVKAQIGNKNLFYSYDGKVGINEESTFEKIAKKNMIKSKNIICPECKENIKMDIIDYKVNLFDCKNGHKIENILLDEFEETQKIDLNNIIFDICKKIIKVHHIIIYFINV